MHYKTHGTCATSIDLEINDHGVITACAFTGGCQGNHEGICRLVVGRPAAEVQQVLAGVACRGNTSCPDQLSKAIAQYLQGEN